VKLLLAAALLALAPAAAASDAERGRALYELHCLGCHGQSVHSRPKRVAADLDAVRSWVARWNETVGTRWTPEEVDQVTVYLNARYYRYPCPPSLCRVVSLAPAGIAR
jgi:mono/diheme cytochrome c family protein